MSAFQTQDLPLSQETCRQLFSLIDGPLSNVMEDTMEIPFMNDPAYNALLNDDSNNDNEPSVYDEKNLMEEWQSKEDLKLVEWSSISAPNTYISNLDQKRPISSLPASENWPGDFQFTVSFSPQKATKGVSWIFSKENNKLYVDKDCPCPINFKTNTIMEEGLFIRAMPLFNSSDHVLEKVTRCINHSVDELTKGVLEAEHLVRCESKNAVYEKDTITGRHSVLVPYENPPVGQMYTTYLFKFACYGSCAGGPNRRALMVVFTLERRGGEVIGRQKIDLKVCACPVRDYNADENKAKDKKSKENKPLKRPNKDDFPATNQLPAKKAREESEFTITVRDKKCYQFLKKMKRIYTMYSVVKTNPSVKAFLSSQSSNDETDA